MKNILFISALVVIITAGFLSCNKDEDIEGTMTIFFDIPSDSANFNIDYMLDSASLSYAMGGDLENITTLELTEVKYEVTNYSGPDDEFITAVMKVSDEEGAGVQELGTINNQQLISLLNNKQVLALNNDGAARFAGLIINPPHAAKLNLAGYTTPGTGIILVIAGIYKFKQHKDNPTF